MKKPTETEGMHECTLLAIPIYKLVLIYLFNHNNNSFSIFYSQCKLLFFLSDKNKHRLNLLSSVNIFIFLFEHKL